MDEKIIATKAIYDGRLVKLDVHDIELPDGRRSQREVIRHPGAVAIVPLDAQQQVFLVRQYRIAADQITLEVPAGTLEPGELPLTCAERELQEEIGYRATSLEPLGGFYVAPGYTTEYIHLYLGTDLTKAALPQDDDEFIEVQRMPLADALELINSGEINDSKTMASLLRVARKLGI